MDRPQLSGLPDTVREMVRDATRYWEPGRITYNLVLASIEVAWLVLTWPHFHPAFAVQSLLALLALAATANACYSVAYFADITMQRSSFRGIWQRLHIRYPAVCASPMQFFRAWFLRE